MGNVYIVVKNGCVTAVYSTGSKTKVELIDLDVNDIIRLTENKKRLSQITSNNNIYCIMEGK